MFIRRDCRIIQFFLTQEAEPQTNLTEFLRTREWIGVSFKESSILLNGEAKRLEIEDYISREAAGIDLPFKLERLRLKEFDVYRVRRLAAGTNLEVLLHYVFKGGKVLRVGIFPYREGDEREEIVYHLISSAYFLE